MSRASPADALRADDAGIRGKPGLATITSPTRAGSRAMGSRSGEGSDTQEVFLQIRGLLSMTLSVGVERVLLVRDDYPVDPRIGAVAQLMTPGEGLSVVHHGGGWTQPW